ncbi:PfkB family carbohydrate kinase [soil metagenome]
MNARGLATPHRVVVAGDANPDLVLRGDVVPRFGQAEQLLDAAELTIGGSAGIMACGLARLGVPVSLVAVVGDDLFGRETVASLAAAGVDVSNIEVRAAAATGLSIHLAVPGDRAILTLPGTIPELRAAAVRAAIEATDARWLHIASPFLNPGVTAELPGLLAAARADGVGTSLDPNWDPAERWTSLEPALAALDVLLPNRAELAALAAVLVVAEGGTEQPAVLLAARGPRVVVKDGAEGGWSLDPAGVHATAPGIHLDVVDTTGAGDSFDAGYLAAIAYGVTDEAERLRWATVAGSLSTRDAGGTNGQATLDELRAAL